MHNDTRVFKYVRTTGQRVRVNGPTSNTATATDNAGNWSEMFGTRREQVRRMIGA